MEIRPAVAADVDAMWAIFQTVIATGDTLPFSVSFDKETFISQWFSASQATFVAICDTRVAGMCKVGANYPDLGAHVSSATYLVDPAMQGRGIGRALVQHSIAYAQEAGFMSMQFNYVVSTNTVAVSLYEKLGFAIVGRLQKAFNHQRLGYVDAYVMSRFL